MSRNTCERCRFWEHYGEPRAIGTCHRYPPPSRLDTSAMMADTPQASSIETPKEKQQRATSASDYLNEMANQCQPPYTDYDYWCGEWQAEEP